MIRKQSPATVSTICFRIHHGYAVLRSLRGIRSFAHALLFFCKQSFKTLGISILYTCQETTDNFLFKEFHKIFYVII